MNTSAITRRQWLHASSALAAVAFAGNPLKCLADPAIAESGTSSDALQSFDELMRSFVSEHKPQGAALAVSRNSQVAYARGFGWADEACSEVVQPESLFRIASISKPITAVAILQLVERGKLSLSDRIVDVLVLTDAKDERWKQITILQLLQHTAGFDRGASFDPMFRPLQIAEHFQVDPPAEPWHIIQYMCERPLDFDPGEKYVYSNFGYCLLGRAIEQIAGETYEDFVKQSVLAPIGVSRMRIGQSLASVEGEVWYNEHERRGRAVVGPIGSRVPLPYGSFYLEPMDSHGAWIASAPDLVRFASAFDQPEQCPLLKAKTIQQMFAPPTGAAGHDESGDEKNRYYGCGWSIVQVRGSAMNAFHSGSLSGTGTMLVRRHDGLNWAILFSTRNNADRQYLPSLIDPLIHRAADAVKEWPV